MFTKTTFLFININTIIYSLTLIKTSSTYFCCSLFYIIKKTSSSCLAYICKKNSESDLLKYNKYLDYIDNPNYYFDENDLFEDGVKININLKKTKLNKIYINSLRIKNSDEWGWFIDISE
jgi:hypothetical protein